MKHPEKVTVVLPVYGGREAIATVVRDLAVAAYSLRVRKMELKVLVLDGDRDAADVAARTASDMDLALEVMPGPADVGRAYIEGFRRVAEDGAVDLVVTLDANGRHDATQIPRLIDHLIEGGFHVVIGSRWARGSGTPGLSPARWLFGRLANLLFRYLTASRGIADATTSFRVARLEVVRSFSLTRIPINSHSVQTAFVANAIAKGYRVAEASIIYRPPLGGGGGLGMKDVAQFSTHLLALRKQVERTRRLRLSVRGRSFSNDYFGAAQDLERLGTAKYFFEWVLDEFDPYLHGRVLEVGAGLGTITRKLIDRHTDLEIVALEPADNMFDDLNSYAALAHRVSAYQQTLRQYDTAGDQAFDAVIYINVLEHIEEDEYEIQMAAKALRAGGALLVFGPALEKLYSELDYRAGHYRRYSVGRLRNLVAKAGLQLESIRYFDILGVIPYYVVYKLLGHSEISGSGLWAYDRLVVPISRVLQTAVPHPPFGKNVILVALKPDA